MRKQHVSDLLSGKIASTFVTFIENSDHTDSLLWECVINQNCNKQPCLVVKSGTHSYSTTLQHKTSISFLNTHEYDNYVNLLNAIRDWNSKAQCGTTSQGSFIFIDSLAWFILDYPNECEFECWVQQLLISIFELSFQSNIQRVVLRFQPIRDASGQYYAGSDDIIKILESISTSFVHCGSIKYSYDRVLQYLDVWHRRTVQGEWSKSLENLFMFSKPAFTESGQIELDPRTLAILNFSPGSEEFKPIDTDFVIPQSTFDLSLSESEKEARSRVVLPYEMPHTKFVDASVTKADDCNIHYTPDCFDDLDEEDPDDDLDI